MVDAEREVERLSRQIAKCDGVLADPALYADAAKAQKLVLERGMLASSSRLPKKHG